MSRKARQQSRSAPAPEYIVVGRCPECDGTLVLRSRRQDNNPFFGCTGYPRCVFTASYDAALHAITTVTMREPVIAELASRNSQLESQVDGLRRDRARLDALERDVSRLNRLLDLLEDERDRLLRAAVPHRPSAGTVTAHDVRSILAWAHPDKHPDGTVEAHELAVRLTALLDRVK